MLWQVLFNATAQQISINIFFCAVCCSLFPATSVCQCPSSPTREQNHKLFKFLYLERELFPDPEWELHTFLVENYGLGLGVSNSYSHHKLFQSKLEQQFLTWEKDIATVGSNNNQSARFYHY